MNDIFSYLNDICAEIKYKTVHAEIRSEVRAHIEDSAAEYEARGFKKEEAVRIAIRCAGDAKKLGRIFNRHYAMPFNCRFGLSVWAALVTMVIYFAYPLFYKVFNHTIKTENSSILIIAAIAVFALLNWLYLRRGHLKFALRDCRDILFGFLAGYAASVGILLGISAFGRFGFYPYFQDVEILAKPPYIPLIPSDESVFCIEYFCLWFCIMLYLASVFCRKKVKPFSFVTGFFNITNGEMLDEDIFYTMTDGKRRLSDISLGRLGLFRDKYGEKQEIKDKKDRMI